MQQQILTKLSSILSHSHASNQPSTAKQQISHLLTQFFQHITQQFIKLSAYYQTKLQYQSIAYQKQMIQMSQQIQRQDKVISLMRLEFEDLIVLLNEERNGRGYQGGGEQITAKQVMMRDEEQNKQWRVKKSQLIQEHYQKQKHTVKQNHSSTTDNSNSSNNNNSQLSQSVLSSYPPPQQRSSTSTTISGLEIIAEEQTERTLISVGDQQEHQKMTEEGYFVDGDGEGDGDVQFEERQQNQVSQEKVTRLYGKMQENCQKHMLIVIKDDHNDDEHVKGQSQRIDFNSNQSPDKEQQHPINISCKDIVFVNQNSSNSQSKRQLISQEEEDESQILLQQQKIRFESVGQFNSHQHVNHQTSITPKIYVMTEQSQKSYHKISANMTNKTATPQLKNFVENPFSKKKLSHPHSRNEERIHQQQLSDNNIQKIKWESDEKHQQSEGEQLEKKNHRLFEEQQFRQSFVQNYYQSQRQQNQNKIKNRNSVMSILQMIALNNNHHHSSNNNSNNLSKRSQCSNKSSKVTSSHSKSKGKAKNKKSTCSNNESKPNNLTKSTKSKKNLTNNNKKPNFYHHQTQEYHESQSDIENNNNSRVTMTRCPTSQDVSSTSQRYHHYPTSLNDDNDTVQFMTTNDFGESESCEKEVRSFHSTFGRLGSQKHIKQPLQVNVNHQNIVENFTKGNQRKDISIIKSRKQPYPSQKQNFGHNNKENQIRRRMSQKLPQSKTSLGHCAIVNKKLSTKYLKPSNNHIPSQQSIHSMLQSHLQNSNKFIVGTKKQQVKYDGQKITIGLQQLRHGHGVLYYSNGLIYEGEFVQNRRCGFGLLKFNHVQLYSGEWEGDEMNGKGKIRNCAIINKKKKQATQPSIPTNITYQPFTKWISYCGQFMNNKFEGEGTLYLQGGQKFVGWFRNGVADGQGSLFRKNGEVENGLWRNNVLVEKYAFDLSMG